MIAQDPKASAPLEQGSESATLLGAHVSQILEHASRIAEVRAELVRRRFARRAILIALGALVGVVLAAVALLAAWQLVRGISQGLADWTGHSWLGDFLSGALLLALVLGGALIALARLDPDNRKARAELEQRESAAWEGLQSSVTGLGEELVRAGELREKVRAHPYLSLGAGLAAGIAAAPLLAGLARFVAPLARGALSGLPGIAPILRRARGPSDPTSSAR